MLKKNLMLIGDAKYILYELKTRKFYRFDIMEKGGEFHLGVGYVLFSLYRKKRRKWYGDMELYQKYIDTVTFLQKMQGETTSQSGWEMEKYRNYSSFYHTVQKGEVGNRLVTKTRNGEWYEETFEHNGITIFMCIDDENYKIELIPINDREYQKWGVNA